MIFGDPRVPFDRPVQATSGFVPRSLDTGFIPTEMDPFSQVMLPRLARLPAGVHHPLVAESGVLPSTGAEAVAVAATAQPPSATAIKKRSMRMMPPALLMAIGVFPSPGRGNVRGGLDPSRLVSRGRNPGV